MKIPAIALVVPLAAASAAAIWVVQKPGLGADPAASITPSAVSAQPLQAEKQLDRVRAETRAAVDAQAARLRQEAEDGKAAELIRASERSEVERKLAREIVAVAAQVVQQDDSFRQSSWAVGPAFGGGRLRKNNQTGKVYLYSDFDDFHSAAADQWGARFEVIEVNRPWEGRSAVELTQAYLDEHAHTGFSVKFWGGTGEHVVAVAPEQALGFLAATASPK